MSEYRIYRYGVKCYGIQKRFLWFFWTDFSAYSCKSAKEAGEIIKKFEEEDAVYGEIIYPEKMNTRVPSTRRS